MKYVINCYNIHDAVSGTVGDFKTEDEAVSIRDMYNKLVCWEVYDVIEVSDDFMADYIH